MNKIEVEVENKWREGLNVRIKGPIVSLWFCYALGDKWWEDLNIFDGFKGGLRVVKRDGMPATPVFSSLEVLPLTVCESSSFDLTLQLLHLYQFIQIQGQAQHPVYIGLKLVYAVVLELARTKEGILHVNSAECKTQQNRGSITAWNKSRNSQPRGFVGSAHRVYSYVHPLCCSEDSKQNKGKLQSPVDEKCPTSDSELRGTKRKASNKGIASHEALCKGKLWIPVRILSRIPEVPISASRHAACQCHHMEAHRKLVRLTEQNNLDCVLTWKAEDAWSLTLQCFWKTLKTAESSTTATACFRTRTNHCPTPPSSVTTYLAMASLPASNFHPSASALHLWLWALEEYFLPGRAT